MPTVHPVEVVSSLAHRQEEQVRLVLHLPGTATPAAASVPLRFKDGQRRFTQPATVREATPGVVLEVLVPAGRLGRGVWTLSFRPEPERPFERIQARLLTSARQPVSLIPGPVPATRLAEPSPDRRSPARSRGRRLLGRVAGRVRRSGRR